MEAEERHVVSFSQLLVSDSIAYRSLKLPGTWVRSDHEFEQLPLVALSTP